MSVVEPPAPVSKIDLHRIERYLGYLLRMGVLLSAIFLVGGVMVSLVRHPEYLSDPKTLPPLTQPGAAFPHKLHNLVRELGQGRGRAIMTVGLLILIATPVLRVVVSVVVFAIERNWRFVLLTGLVLIVLVVSFLLGKVE